MTAWVSNGHRLAFDVRVQLPDVVVIASVPIVPRSGNGASDATRSSLSQHSGSLVAKRVSATATSVTCVATGISTPGRNLASAIITTPTTCAASSASQERKPNDSRQSRPARYAAGVSRMATGGCRSITTMPLAGRVVFCVGGVIRRWRFLRATLVGCGRLRRICPDERGG